MSDVTRILDSIQNGDSSASADLLPLVYDELRQLAASHMARETVNHTLSATALVHEAYLRLVGPTPSQSDSQWDGKGHFFAAAAQAMRRILIDSVRHKKRLKRGGGENQRIELSDSMLGTPELDDEMLAVHEALDRLALVSPEKARLVELRYFAGLSSNEAAMSLGISKATADRHWSYARAWLRREIEA